MKKPTPGHRALQLLGELVALVKDRTAVRMFITNNAHLKRIHDSAEDVVRDATRGVAPYDLKPHGEHGEMLGFCEFCGSYHAEGVEVRA
jgi:hypothetical protein